jgi:hypothetical protein
MCPSETDGEEPIEHRIDLVGHLDGVEVSCQEGLRDDKLGAEFLQAVESRRNES